MAKHASKVPVSQIHPAYYDDPAPVEIPRDRGGTWVILGLIWLVLFRRRKSSPLPSCKSFALRAL